MRVSSSVSVKICGSSCSTEVMQRGFLQRMTSVSYTHLNLLGCYVHDLRLQCLEFFNKFYVDGGKPFRPMTLDTEYVDLQ